MPLSPKTVLMVPNEPVHHVYFVETGTVSMIAILENGEEIEVGLVGFEGMAGLPVLLGAPTSPIEAIIQTDAAVFRLPAAAFRQAIADHPSMMVPLLRYVDAFLFQVSQTAVCNGHHQIEQRLARWTLMTQDRVKTDRFVMTQQFLSYMLGVQRPSVTLVVGTLQKAGLIRHHRGEMEVLDRPGLEAVACECYHVVRQRYHWLFE
ncbi:MAG: Crp/Fnr family transcriptional regulator [Janthinobacterium lividum]